MKKLIIPLIIIAIGLLLWYATRSETITDTQTLTPTSEELPYWETKVGYDKG